MLVLTRRARPDSDRIHIGDDIVLYITKVDGGNVSIGIDAPKHIPVHRGEIYDAIQRERAANE